MTHRASFAEEDDWEEMLCSPRVVRPSYFRR